MLLCSLPDLFKESTGEKGARPCSAAEVSAGELEYVLESKVYVQADGLLIARGLPLDLLSA